MDVLLGCRKGTLTDTRRIKLRNYILPGRHALSSHHNKMHRSRKCEINNYTNDGNHLLTERAPYVHSQSDAKFSPRSPDMRQATRRRSRCRSPKERKKIPPHMHQTHLASPSTNSGPNPVSNPSRTKDDPRRQHTPESESVVVCFAGAFLTPAPNPSSTLRRQAMIHTSLVLLVEYPHVHLARSIIPVAAIFAAMARQAGVSPSTWFFVLFTSRKA
jgi:hypothetical protein